MAPRTSHPPPLHRSRENIWEKINPLRMKWKSAGQWRGEEDARDRQTDTRQSGVSYGAGSAAWTRSGRG